MKTEARGYLTPATGRQAIPLTGEHSPSAVTGSVPLSLAADSLLVVAGGISWQDGLFFLALRLGRLNGHSGQYLGHGNRTTWHSRSDQAGLIDFSNVKMSSLAILSFYLLCIPALPGINPGGQQGDDQSRRQTDDQAAAKH